MPGNTLITATPEEGRRLAVHMAQLVIRLAQPDEKVRETLRPGYASNAADLIAITHTVALEFATIAAANNYWPNRDRPTKMNRTPDRPFLRANRGRGQRREGALCRLAFTTPHLPGLAAPRARQRLPFGQHGGSREAGRRGGVLGKTAA